MARDHFDISSYKRTYDYVSKIPGRSNVKYPQRDRMAHSQRVARMFLEAKEADRHARDAAQVNNYREGFYLKILSGAGYGLAVDKIDSKSAVNLLNVKEQGDEEQKRLEATFYLKQGKEDWLDKKVDEYQHKDTSKHQPLNKPLIDSIEEIVCAQVEDLWIGDEAIPQEDRKWIEVWFFVENAIEANHDQKRDMRQSIEMLGVEVKEGVLTFIIMAP